MPYRHCIGRPSRQKGRRLHLCDTPTAPGEIGHPHRACGLGGLFLLIALLAALDFDGAFTVFHSIFFPGKDNWLFDPVTDPVILILPEAFFRNCAIAIVTVLLTVCIMLVVTGRKRPSRRSAPGEGTAS